MSFCNILQNARDFERYALLAADGEIGAVEALYFDEMKWVVRYLMVNTGSWLMGRRVLISPVAVGEVREDDKTISIELTRGQIASSPPVDTKQPLSRSYEAQYYRHYHWPVYWEVGPQTGTSGSTPVVPEPVSRETKRSGHQDKLLHSTAEIKGDAAVARDGAIGYIRDFVVDTRYWVIRYLEIETRNGCPGGDVLVCPAWIERVRWADRVVSIDLVRDRINSAPGFDPSQGISRDYEIRLFQHYGRPVYWQRRTGPH